MARFYRQFSLPAAPPACGVICARRPRCVVSRWSSLLPAPPSLSYRYESILHTLLHELVHNTHGNHSVAFYRLLDEIREGR